MPPRLPSVIPGIVFPAIPNKAASFRLAFQFQLEQSQWETPAALAALQLTQLRHVIRHAIDTTPYYRDLFASRGLTLPAEIDEAFFLRLPVSRRSDLQEAGDRLISTAPPRDHGPAEYATTSGSTGRPLRFGRTAATQMNWLAFALRDHLWHGRNPQGKLCTIRVAPPGEAQPPDGEQSPDWGGIVAPVFATGPASRLNVTASLDEQLAWLDRERPDYLLSYPSNLLALVEHAARNERPLPRVRELRPIGEMLTAETRRRLTEAWAKVTDLYSCEETGYLALQCPEQEQYHVQSENVRIEILDEDDQPCPPGIPGRVVITSLNNFLTPFIRYDLGDYAEFGEPCPCGRGLPVLRHIHGRKRNRFVLPDGRSISPSIGERRLVTLIPDLRISQFRCIQHSAAMIEMQLVTDRAVTPEEQGRLADSIRENLGHPFEVTFSFHTDIDRGPTGKFETYLCRVNT